MDLDDLKKIWSDNQPSGPPLQVAALEEMIRQKTQTALARFRRMLVRESVLSTVLVVPILVWSFWRLPNQQLLVLIPVLLLLMLATMALYFNRYKRMKRASNAPNLQQGLQLTIKMLERFIRWYIGLGTFAAFVGALLARLHVEDVLLRGKTLLYRHNTPVEWVITLAIVIIIPMVMSYFISKFVDKTYGRYLKQLRANLQELMGADESE